MEYTQLMREMIEQCRTVLVNQRDPAQDLPRPVGRAHLLGMCSRMLDHLDDWSVAKLNRWIGYIQCGLIANRFIDLDGAKEMFNQAKNAFGEPGRDLVDHLDPDVPFHLDIGGQG